MLSACELRRPAAGVRTGSATPRTGDGLTGHAPPDAVAGNVLVWDCSSHHNEEYVHLMPEVKCWEGDHIPMVVFSAFWFAAYNIGLPAFLLYKLVTANAKCGPAAPPLPPCKSCCQLSRGTTR